MNTTIIIVTYKRSSLAIQLATKIRESQPSVEIIIVDQQNSAGLPESEIVRKRIQYLNLPTAQISKARNAGIRAATGDIVIFFDDDVEITDQTIPAHINGYTDNDIIGVAGRVINDGEPVPEDTDVAAGKTNVLATVFTQQFWSTRKQEVDFPYGCNMSFRRNALTQIDGFDEQLDHFDEIDVARRIMIYGKILFEPAALVYHHKVPTGGARKNNPDTLQEMYRCYGYFIAKNVKFPLSLISMVLRTKTAFVEGKNVITYLYQGYYSFFRTI